MLRWKKGLGEITFNKFIYFVHCFFVFIFIFILQNWEQELGNYYSHISFHRNIYLFSLIKFCQVESENGYYLIVTNLFNFISFLGVQNLLTHESKICAHLLRKLLLNSLKATRVKENCLMYKEVKNMWQELVSDSDTPMFKDVKIHVARVSI